MGGVVRLIIQLSQLLEVPLGSELGDVEGFHDGSEGRFPARWPLCPVANSRDGEAHGSIRGTTTSTVVK